MFVRWWHRGLLVLVLFVAGFYLYGCGAGVTTTNVQTTEQNLNEAVKYEGPKARIAVASFKCKAAKCGGNIGSGIRDMLVDALVRSGKFIVVERGEGLEEIKKELELGQSGLVQQGKAPQPGLLEGADILVVGSIVAFEPNAGGIKGGLGGLIPNIPLIGGVKVGKEEAYIALTLRFIDVRTGRIINSTRVEGKASSFSVGGLGGGILGTIPLGGGLEVYKNTPMEKAVMVLIDNAVKAIEKYVPESYYRYNAQGQPVSQTTPVQTQVEKPQTAQKIEGSTTFQQAKEVSLKPVFVDDFNSYGIGQTPPFGKWEGDSGVAVKQVVQVDGRIGKALDLRGGNVCIETVRLKDFVIEADFTRPGGPFEIKFRLQKNPFSGYALFYDESRFVLYKLAGDMKVKIAENRGDFRTTNKWSHLKLVVNGSNIKAYANQNDIVIDINDDDPSLNREGIICIWGDHRQIDNIRIYTVE
ncbi:CsgG/HfaB family protein [Persephonella sp.]